MSIRTVVESLVGDGESPEADEGASEDDWAAEEDGDGEFPNAGGIDGLEDGEGDAGGLDDPFGSGTDDLATDELENRINEVENEIESLSSTVETVQAENEHISATVDDVEENIRKLLDIYEMVTKGINPFADDVDSGFGSGQDADFGLFEDDEEADDDDDLDDTVESADPEGFFDEDLPDDVPLSDPEFDEAEEFVEAPTDESASNGDSATGTSFEELKDEYTAGSDDHTVPPESPDENSESGSGEGDEPVIADPAEIESPDTEATVAETGADSTDVPKVGTDGSGPEPGDANGHGVEEPLQNGNQLDGGTDAATPETRAATADESSTGPRVENKPYLGSLPSGYSGELLVHEWLAILVDEVGIQGAAEALEYYQSIGWIDSTVADQLRSRLTAHDGDGDGGLTTELHNQSLDYLRRLRPGSWNWVLFQSARDGDSSGIQH